MGRKRSLHHDLPPLVYQKGERLYYSRRWIPLGKRGDPRWVHEYARLHGTMLEGAIATFDDAARHYLAHELHKRAAKTQREYTRQLKVLCAVFGRMPLAAITTQHVAKYMAKRSAKHAATREKALFSAVFNVAREAGLVNAPNPCSGMKLGMQSRRDRYVTDAELAAVAAVADRPCALFLWLLYRTGADASVVLKLRRDDVRDGALWVRRTKTGARTQIAIEGPLKALLDAPAAVASLYLVADDRGQPFNLQSLRRHFWTARAKVKATWQLRDLRAKAASDVGDVEDARKLLGHAAVTTTTRYRRSRVGERAKPVMREIEE